jgi:hypothetical protein
VIERIAQHSDAIPQQINAICNNAMVAAYATGQKKISPDMIEEMAVALRNESGSEATTDLGPRQSLFQIVQQLRQSSISPGQLALWRFRSVLARMSRRQIIGVTLMLCFGVGLTLMKTLSEAWWGREPARAVSSPQGEGPSPSRGETSESSTERTTGSAKQSKRQVPRAASGQQERSLESESPVKE